MNNNLIKKYLEVQKQKDNLLEQIENKFDIEIYSKEIQDYTNIKWIRKIDKFDRLEIYNFEKEINYINNLFGAYFRDTKIFEDDDIIIFYYKGIYSSGAGYFTDDPECIALLKSNEMEKIQCM